VEKCSEAEWLMQRWIIRSPLYGKTIKRNLDNKKRGKHEEVSWSVAGIEAWGVKPIKIVVVVVVVVVAPCVLAMLLQVAARSTQSDPAKYATQSCVQWQWWWWWW